MQRHGVQGPAAPGPPFAIRPASKPVRRSTRSARKTRISRTTAFAIWAPQTRRLLWRHSDPTVPVTWQRTGRSGLLAAVRMGAGARVAPFVRLGKRSSPGSAPTSWLLRATTGSLRCGPRLPLSCLLATGSRLAARSSGALTPRECRIARAEGQSPPGPQAWLVAFRRGYVLQHITPFMRCVRLCAVGRSAVRVSPAQGDSG